MTLHISNFGGGVALLGSADTERTDELLECDSYDIGERGQLVVASDLSNFADILDALGQRVFPIYGIALSGTPQTRQALVIGLGDDGTGLHPQALLALVIDLATLVVTRIPIAAAGIANGFVITAASFPFVDRTGTQQKPLVVCIGGREGKVTKQIPLKVYSGTAELVGPDWLGTGAGQFNEATAGTKAKSLYPRGVGAYNNHLMLWGFDSKDPTAGDGANRLMFSNVGNPLKIGNDPLTAGDRDFADTDAINIGGAGEIIRAALSWQGKYWIATNRELHYLAGFGRESFLTNGTVGIRKSRNVCGPKCLIEGPDGLLYGVSTEGLWGFDGGAVEPLYRRLVDFRGKSFGWWDLIWQDSARGDVYPGTTNQDLVWMLSDPESMQVWVVIPFCDAAAGYGFGGDTVVIKYHTQSGGFTRQVFTGKILTDGFMLRREALAPGRRYIVHSQQASNQIKVYRAKADASVSPILPTALPAVTFGEYAPFGPDDAGVTRRIHLTVSWDAAASLPIVLTLTPTIDGEALAAVALSIQNAAPGAPANGDLWLDTSGTDTSIGNATAGALIPASADYLLKRWVASWAKWVPVPLGGGEKGTRVTMPIAFEGKPSDRIKVRVQTVAAAGRYQIEGLGLEPLGVET